MTDTSRLERAAPGVPADTAAAADIVTALDAISDTGLAFSQSVMVFAGLFDGHEAGPTLCAALDAATAAAEVTDTARETAAAIRAEIGVVS